MEQFYNVAGKTSMGYAKKRNKTYHKIKL